MTLENNAIDRATSGGKIATSFIPILGSAVGELLGQLIPAQRVDRIVDFIRRLDAKVAHLTDAVKAERVKRDVDLIEAGLWHATRAASEERRERIACLVAGSMASEQVDGLSEKKLLDLMAELNDAELLILQWFAISRTGQADDFHQRHQDVLFAPPAHLGSSSAEVDKEVVHRSYREHLVRLNLVHPTFNRVRRGETPEFDESTGTLKVKGHEITWLGRMVLGAAGLEDDLRSQRRADEQSLEGQDSPDA